MCTRIKFVAILFLLILLSISHSQNKKTGEDKPDGAKPTFKLPVNLVVVNATVLDKDGKSVSDLVQSDFKIYEDGKLQTIQTFAVESYEPDLPESSGKENESAPRGTSSRIENASRPRMILLLIDDLTTGSVDRLIFAEKAITKFVREDVPPEDQISVAAASGRAQIPFSSDRQAILDGIRTVFAKLNLNFLTKEDCPTLTDLQAKRIADDYIDTVSPPVSKTAKPGEIAMQAMQAVSGIPDLAVRVALFETIACLSLDPEDDTTVPLAKMHMRTAASRQHQEAEYRSSTLLHTIRVHLRSLKHFNAAKSLILFSDGFLSEGTSSISFRLQDVVDQALASGVVLDTIDIRGLYTLMPPADHPPGSTLFNLSQYKQSVYMDDTAAQEAPLFRLANETGGLFFHNSNDIYSGLKTIMHRQSTYYVLTYAMPSQKPDGRYHKIKLEVDRPGVELTYRKGYYAPREELTFERRKKEDIQEALQAPANLNEIPIGLAYNYFQEDTSTYSLALATNISVRGIHFIEEGSRRKNLIHLVVAAYDKMGHYVDGIEKSIDFKLTEESYANILTYGINSKVEFKLPMGRYKIKAVVREAGEGKMGSANRTVEIP